MYAGGVADGSSLRNCIGGVRRSLLHKVELSHNCVFEFSSSILFARFNVGLEFPS